MKAMQKVQENPMLHLRHQSRMQIQQQIQSAEVQMQEMDRLGSALNESKSIKKGQDMLVPLGQGIFLRANARDLKNVVMSVGADVIVEKSFDEALEIVKKQQGELGSILLDMRHEFNTGVQQLHEMQHELNQAAEEEPAEKKVKKK